MSMISRVGLVGDSTNAVLVFGPHRGAPGVEIRAVDQGRSDAEARQKILDHIETRAEQRLGGDDVVASLQLAHQRGGDGRHAACGGARRLRAFEERHAALEHRDGRVGEARIDEARIVALEARFGLLHRVVEIALGEEQRLGGLLEPATAASRRGSIALRAAASSGSRDLRGVVIRSLLSGAVGARGLKDEGEWWRAPRSFSPMFNVAASRPAQMTTESAA